jgi:hypothetical protein
MPRASLVEVVEDDRFLRESMRRLVKSLGYSGAARGVWFPAGKNSARKFKCHPAILMLRSFVWAGP